MNSIFNLLLKFYKEEDSYIKATLKYIDEILDIDISEFNVSDLPSDWLTLLELEARHNKTLKKSKTNIFKLE